MIAPFTPTNGFIFYITVLLVLNTKINQNKFTTTGYLGLCWTNSSYPNFCLFNYSFESIKVNYTKPLILKINQTISEKYFYPLNNNPVKLKLNGTFLRKNGYLIFKGKIVQISFVNRVNCSKKIREVNPFKNKPKIINASVCSHYIPIMTKKIKWINITYNGTCSPVVFKPGINNTSYIFVINCTLNKKHIEVLGLAVTNFIALSSNAKLIFKNVPLNLLSIGNNKYLEISNKNLSNKSSLIVISSCPLIIIFNKSKSSILALIKEEFGLSSTLKPNFTIKQVLFINNSTTIESYQNVSTKIPQQNLIFVIGATNHPSYKFFVYDDNLTYNLSMINNIERPLYIIGLPVYYIEKRIMMPSGVNLSKFVVVSNS